MEINDSENMEIHKEIEDLERKLFEKKASLEKGTGKIETKVEVAKEKTHEQFQQTSSDQTAADANDEKEKSKVKEEIRKIKDLDTSKQVKILVALAFEKGISYSIKIARSLNDAYLLDELHDKLIGELYEEFVNKGKLKKI